MKTSRTVVALCSVTALVGGFTVVGCTSVDTDGSKASLAGNDGALGLALQHVVSLADASGYNGAFSGSPALLATAGANTAFRGVAFAPHP